MIKKENRCVGCCLVCTGNRCQYSNVNIFYCDNCKEETDELYEYKNKQLCKDCVTKEILNEIEKDSDVEDADLELEQELLMLNKVEI